MNCLPIDESHSFPALHAAGSSMVPAKNTGQPGGGCGRSGRVAPPSGRRDLGETGKAGAFYLARRRHFPVRKLGPQAWHAVWRAISQHPHLGAGDSLLRIDAPNSAFGSPADRGAQPHDQGQCPLQRGAAHSAGRSRKSRREISLFRVGRGQIDGGGSQRTASLRLDQARQRGISIGECRIFGCQIRSHRLW